MIMEIVEIKHLIEHWSHETLCHHVFYLLFCATPILVFFNFCSFSGVLFYLYKSKSWQKVFILYFPTELCVQCELTTVFVIAAGGALLVVYVLKVGVHRNASIQSLYRCGGGRGIYTDIPMLKLLAVCVALSDFTALCSLFVPGCCSHKPCDRTL